MALASVVLPPDVGPEKMQLSRLTMMRSINRSAVFSSNMPHAIRSSRVGLLSGGRCLRIASVVPRASTPLRAPANRNPPMLVDTTAFSVPDLRSLPWPPALLATAVSAISRAISGRTIPVFSIAPLRSTKTSPPPMTMISVTNGSFIKWLIGCRFDAMMRSRCVAESM